MLSSRTMTALARKLAGVPMPQVDVDQRVIVHGVDFRTYSAVRDLLEGPGVRLTYLRGALEIMSPSRRHEDIKKRIARLVELYALERDFPLYGYGSTTFRREATERGLEPDECYCVGKDMAEYPDIAIEVAITSGGIDKLVVYEGLSVRELWFWKGERFELYALGNDGFALIPRSQKIPELDFEALARFVGLPDQHQAVLEYRAFLRASAPAL